MTTLNENFTSGSNQDFKKTFFWQSKTSLISESINIFFAFIIFLSSQLQYLNFFPAINQAHAHFPEACKYLDLGLAVSGLM
jgi:hypothetical protein